VASGVNRVKMSMFIAHWAQNVVAAQGLAEMPKIVVAAANAEAAINVERR
jgi:uncharacterized protein YfdQ (DUF2303 family)